MYRRRLRCNRNICFVIGACPAQGEPAPPAWPLPAWSNEATGVTGGAPAGARPDACRSFGSVAEESRRSGTYSLGVTRAHEGKIVGFGRFAAGGDQRQHGLDPRQRLLPGRGGAGTAGRRLRNSHANTGYTEIEPDRLLNDRGLEPVAGMQERRHSTRTPSQPPGRCRCRAVIVDVTMASRMVASPRQDHHFLVKKAVSGDGSRGSVS